MLTDSTIFSNSIKSSLIEHSDRSFSFIIEPLAPGYGYTLGNTLRRILLSSVPGYAITKVKINGVSHEYQPIVGVMEDAMDVILNLKQLRCSITNDEDRVTINLNKTAGGKVLASDIKTGGKVEIANPDLYICSLNDKSKLDIEIEVSKGAGYLSMEEVNLSSTLDPEEILVDAVFTPVTSVMLNVEKVRVGDKTNFDKLEIKFDTDGSASGREVIDFALDLALGLLNRIKSGFEANQDVKALPKVAKTEDKEVIKVVTALKTSTNDEIDLPARIKNILEKNGVMTNSELKEKIGEVKDFAGISEKTVEKIQEYIDSL